eukprot:scaffold16184_cov139-Skeletonema_marinoi.AAC.1
MFTRDFVLHSTTLWRVAEGPGGDRFAAVELFRAFRIFNPSYAKTLSHKDAFALIEKLDHYPIFRKGGHVAKDGMLTNKMLLLSWLILGRPRMARKISQPF